MNLLYPSNGGVMMECQIRITFDELHAQDAIQIYKIFALSSEERIYYNLHTSEKP